MLILFALKKAPKDFATSIFTTSLRVDHEAAENNP
jgi:hypothetical protein